MFIKLGKRNNMRCLFATILIRFSYTIFKPSSDLFTDRSKGCFICGYFFFVICVPRLSLLVSVVSVPCSLAVTCWNRADLLALLCYVSMYFCRFPIVCLGSVWYLVVSISSVYISSHVLPGVMYNVPIS